MAKYSITIDLDSDVKKVLEKRAKKEFLSLRELINEILRRSAVSSKKQSSVDDKTDDDFVKYFSRKKR